MGNFTRILTSHNLPDEQAFDPSDPLDGKLSEADRLLDVNAVAEWLGVSTSTLAKWRLTGKGPRYAKCGKRILMRKSDLDRWLASRLRTSTSNLGDWIGEED